MPVRSDVLMVYPEFAVEKNKVILSLLTKISTAKQLDFLNLND